MQKIIESKEQAKNKDLLSTAQQSKHQKVLISQKLINDLKNKKVWKDDIESLKIKLESQLSQKRIKNPFKSFRSSQLQQSSTQKTNHHHRIQKFRSKLKLKNRQMDAISTKSKQIQKDNQQKQEISVLKRPQRIVFFGQESQIPFVHSQDLKNKNFNVENFANRPQQAIYSSINPQLQSSQLIKIKQLILWNCKISSMRDLGTGWNSLISLSILNCQLTDLSGITGFINLKQLYSSYNKINDISALSSLIQPLYCLDLEKNQIPQSQLIQLQIFSELNDVIEYINLVGNPIWNLKQQLRRLFSKALQVQEEILQADLAQKLFSEINNQLQMMSYHQIQVANSLIKKINEKLIKDDITEKQMNDFKKLLKFQQREFDPDQDIVRYQPQSHQQNEQNQSEQFELYFTPLIHFWQKQQHFVQLNYIKTKIINKNQFLEKPSTIINFSKLKQLRETSRKGFFGSINKKESNIPNTFNRTQDYKPIKSLQKAPLNKNLQQEGIAGLSKTQKLLEWKSKKSTEQVNILKAPQKLISKKIFQGNSKQQSKLIKRRFLPSLEESKQKMLKLNQ